MTFTPGKAHIKVARLTVEVYDLNCPHEGCNAWFEDDRTCSSSLTSDSVVQGTNLNAGDVLTCPECGKKCRVPVVHRKDW